MAQRMTARTLDPPVSFTVNADLAMRARGLRIALVNNMPDGAFAATERQFTRLVNQATCGGAEIGLYVLPAVPRGDAVRAMIAARYRPVEDLYRNGADALIVTGNEPRAARLDAEPYWPDLTRLIGWARDQPGASLWSCLAAHAAVLHLDRIERQRLPAKRSGVYTCATAEDGEALAICHSRLNDVTGADLAARGYDILSASADGHVDAFAKTWTSRFLFLQGHPEYDIDSLAREYRRDVIRYLNGERQAYPALPEHYFDAETQRRLLAFRKRAHAERSVDLLSAYPEITLAQGLEGRLKASSQAVFTLWLRDFVLPALGR